MTKGAARLLTAALCVLVFSGCRAGYIAKVGMEHLRYVRSAVPVTQKIESARAQGETDHVRKLELVLAALDFAQTQGLDVGGSYREVADTTGLATAYVVTAAHNDRLEPYTWRYPVVGSIPYRGYFEREAAEEFASTLSDDLYDTYIVEASGYSTLGWFDDPLPSGVLQRDDVGVASFIFHELLHQTVFIPGSIAFNETLASAVSSAITIRFFEERGETEIAEEARRRTQGWLDQAQACDELAVRLTALFEAVARSGDALDRKKDELFESSRAGLEKVGLVRVSQDGETPQDLNNAWFLALWRYRKNAQDLVAFIDRHETVAAAIAEIERLTDGAADPYLALAAAHSP